MFAQRDPNARSFADESPLTRPMSQQTAGALCTCGVMTVLAVCWCILDFWNHKVSNDLFNIGGVRMVDSTQSPSKVVAPFKGFSYPLTLAFLQFVFMGILFLGLWSATVQQRLADLRGLKLTSDKRWPSLVVSHVFSTFWLQALMMPTVAMSLGAFSASRAVEIPVAAALRSPALGAHLGRKTLQTTALACAAACTLYFAYAELAGCVCIMSGNGVALTGVAFWVVYGLILAMPACNAVCQEAIMLQLEIHPLLLLGLQNIFAAVLFCPVLIISHLIGWEDIGAAFQTIGAYQEVFMLVTWLCAQLALTSVVCIMLIQIADSFWAIALRSLRVMFWGLSMIMTFYMSNPSVPLSIASPRSSFWSFVICCGGCLAAAAIYTDRKAEDDIPENPDKVAGKMGSIST